MKLYELQFVGGVFLSANQRKMIASATAVVILSFQAACAVPGLAFATSTEQAGENMGTITPSQPATPSATEVEPTPTATPLPEWYPSEEEIPSEERIAELMQYVEVKDGFYEPTKQDVSVGKFVFYVIDERNKKVFGFPYGQNTDSLQINSDDVKTYLFTSGNILPNMRNSSMLPYEFLIYWIFAKGYNVTFPPSSESNEVFTGRTNVEDADIALHLLGATSGLAWIFYAGEDLEQVHIIYSGANVDEELYRLARKSSGEIWAGMVVTSQLMDGIDGARKFAVEDLGVAENSIIEHR